MRVAIFKMVENRETTVSEMINREYSLFPNAVYRSGKRRLFHCKSFPLFRDDIRVGGKGGGDRPGALPPPVLIHRNRFAVNRVDSALFHFLKNLEFFLAAE